MDLNKEINLIQGDCLEKMKEIPDKSINLVLIDPPYNINKAEWDKWKTVDAYVEFMGQVFLECQRVLKDNGSFYFFHNDFLQIVELQNFINKNTNFIFKVESINNISGNDGIYVCKDGSIYLKIGNSVINLAGSVGNTYVSFLEPQETTSD